MKDILQNLTIAISDGAPITYNYQTLNAAVWADVALPNLLYPVKFKIEFIELATVMQKLELIDSYNDKRQCYYQDEWQHMVWVFSDLLYQDQLVKICIQNQLKAALELLEKDAMSQVHRFWEMDTLCQQVMLWLLRDERLCPQFIKTCWHIIESDDDNHLFYNQKTLHLALLVKNEPCPLNYSNRKNKRYEPA